MFVHLRIHTEFSVVDSTIRIDELAKTAKADQQVALGITDLTNLYGAIKFYKTMRSQGIKPIIGADVWVQGLGANQADEGQTLSRLLLLVQNQTGYLHLCELVARAWTDHLLPHQATIHATWLAEKSEGLIALSNTRHLATAQQLAQIFPKRLYLELQRAGRFDDETLVAQGVALAAQLQLPVVATHPVQFMQMDDYEAHEARVCIADGDTLSNPKRIRKYTPEQYFKTTQQMETLFADIPSAIHNTIEIAKRCNLKLTLGKARLPNYPTPQRNGESIPIADYFRELSFAGLEERLVQIFPDEARRESHRARYTERLEFEIATIIKMDFPGYFLIVGDFINWAKNNGCPVGPGRGSGAGSLVAYALKITDIDPLAYNLLFERFLNPERVSMPDFDIDFCQSNRDRVIQYVKDRYGVAAVSQIATFGTMAARAAIRDVGRVLDLSYPFVDGISKLIPNKPGTQITLAQALKSEEELQKRHNEDEDVKILLELAQKLEGLTRNVGMHAGGVLIAPGKITDFCPLYQQPGSDSAVSQYDKDDVEAIGLVKFDFLGLATLTILEKAKRLIQSRHEAQKNFSYEALTLDDPAIYRLFSQGNTEAIFQFESRGMQGTLKDAKPTRFEDLIALNALYRPGPMDNIPSFVARKNGREEITYPHPLVADMLAETYGIMVYQEQVMQTAQILGGYSLGSADLLRRAMGKKKVEEMAEQRANFRAGAAKNGIDAARADEIFDLMEKFAGYGFNKSHAAAYSLLAYHTAWLKVYYTAEFYCANMTIEMGDTDKLKVLFEDAQKNGMSFHAPDINQSQYEFVPLSDDLIQYGLGAIKGTGEKAIEAIIEARQTDGEGAFTSLFNFMRRVDKSKLNKRTVEALVKAGAFDQLHGNRAATLASIDLAFGFAETHSKNANQVGLFDMGDDVHGSSTQEPEVIDTPAWSMEYQLLQEKTALGFFMTGHLFDAYAPEVRRFAPKNIADFIQARADRTEAREQPVIAGIVSDVRVINSHRGKLAMFRLDDKSASLEAAVDEMFYQANKHIIAEDRLIVAQGKLDHFGGGNRFTIHQVWDLSSARCHFGKYWLIRFPNNMPAHLIETLQNMTQNFPPERRRTEQGEFDQGIGIQLAITKTDSAHIVNARLELGDNARFFPSAAALEQWQKSLPEEAMEVVY